MRGVAGREAADRRRREGAARQAVDLLVRAAGRSLDHDEDSKTIAIVCSALALLRLVEGSPKAGARALAIVHELNQRPRARRR